MDALLPGPIPFKPFDGETGAAENEEGRHNNNDDRKNTSFEKWDRKD